MAQLVAAVVAAGLWGAGVWKGVQSLGRPASHGIRLLAVFYICLAITVTVWSSPDFVDGLLTPVLGPSPSAFMRNVLPIPALYAGVMFLFYSTGQSKSAAAFWRVRVPIVLWASISLPAWFLTPPQHRGDALTDVTSTGHVIFFAVTLIGLGYYTTGLGAPVTYRLARQAPDRVAQRSLYLAVVGFAICIPLFVGPRMVALLLALAGYTPSAIFEQVSVIGQLTALAFFLAGFGGPVLRAKLSAVRLWLQHLKLTRQMHPLWSAIGTLTEHYQLLREHQGGILPARVHYRFYRRVIECRDGLLLVGRLVEQPTAPTSLDEECDLLLSALNSSGRASAIPAAPGAPASWVFSPPKGLAVEDDAAALVELASALSRRQREAASTNELSGSGAA